MKNRSSRSYRFIRRGAGLATLLLVILGGFQIIDPVGFRRNVFQPQREILFLERELQPLSHWNTIKTIDVPPGEIVTIPPAGENDVKITADLRVPERTGKAPAILLLHGSSPWGRKNGFIQYLSYRLLKEGWIVLAPDERGFGETDDPKNVSDPAAWDIRSDVRKCIDFLFSNPKVDRGKVYVLGHSLGAGYALEAALYDSRVKALILVGPPRFLGGSGKGTVTYWDRIRFSAERGLGKPVEEEVVAVHSRGMDIAEFGKGALKRPGHMPILLIDGENERAADKRFLGKVAADITPPLVYVTLPETGHYVGVYNLFGSRRVYYRPDLFESFMKVFDGFTTGTSFTGERNG